MAAVPAAVHTVQGLARTFLSERADGTRHSNVASAAAAVAHDSERDEGHSLVNQVG